MAVKNSISAHVLLVTIKCKKPKIEIQVSKFNFKLDVLCLKRRASSLLVPTGLSANLLQFKSRTLLVTHSQGKLFTEC